MPFPWKKVKSTKISQFVNDHLHNSQKRRDGSSLVVETGFPTSLVDLFMKNREKLKKPSKRRRQSAPITPLGDDNNPITAGSPTSFPSPVPAPLPMASRFVAGSHTPAIHSPLRCPSPLRGPLLFPLPSEGVNEVLAVGSSDGGAFVGLDEREQGVERGVDANMVLLVVLKMFLVVVLALGTKRLTAGITISAFLLFLLDYVGKHARGLLKPCSVINGVLRSIVQGAWRVLRFKEVKKNGGVLKPELQQEHSLKPGSSSLRSYGSSCLDQEIEAVEPKGYFVTHVEEIQPEIEVVDQDESRFSGRLEYQEIKLQEVVMEKEESMYKGEELKRKSRRAKIRSKMKKLFPKKSRSSGKEYDPPNLEIVKEDSFILCDEQQVDKCQDEGAESESSSELSSTSSGRYKEEDGMSTICASGGLSEISEEACTKKEEKCVEIEAGLTWRYLVIGLIVLIGLIGGRAFALFLTISWLFLLKFSEKLPWYKKVPIIRSCYDKSG